MVSPTIVVTSEEQPAIQVVVTEENVVVISDQLPALSAAQSAAAALVSQQAAAASEVAAAASEDAAALSATAADASEAAALASQVAAAASESSAALSAGTATTQAGIATTQAGIATSAASTATTQAGIATTQASAASASAAAALLSQNSATSSASAALASQNAASASAAAALVSQNSAAASAAAAAQSVIDLTTAISGGTLAASFTTLKASEHIALAATKKLYLDGIAATGDTYLVESSANVLDIYAGGAKTLSLTATGAAVVGTLSATGQATFSAAGDATVATVLLSNSTQNLLELYASGASADHKRWGWQSGSAVGDGLIRLRALNDAKTNGINAISISRSGIASVDLTLGGNTSVPATKKLYLDGGGNTYLTESSADVLDIYAGGVNTLRLSATGMSVAGSVIASGYVQTGGGVYFQPTAGVQLYKDTTNNVAHLNVWDGTANPGFRITRLVSGYGAYDIFNIDSNAAVTAVGVLATTDVTEASSTTVAALKTAGGLAVGKSLRVGLDTYTAGTFYATGGNNTLALRSTNVSTGYTLIQLANSGGNAIFGMENSTGGNNLIIGASGYDTIVRGPSGIAFSADNGAGMQMRLSATGLALKATAKLYIDDGGDTYLTESSANVMDFYAGGTQVVRLSGGKVLIGTNGISGASSSKLQVQQTAGVADWTAVLQADTPSGASYGLKIHAGTTAADYAIYVRNAANSATLLEVKGDGSTNINGIISASDVVSTSGGVGLRLRYGATDYLNIFGSMYSSGATMLGYGVRSSTAASNAFLSTSAAASHPRGALTMDNALRFWQANTSTIAVGSAATLNETFTITTAGDMVTQATKKHYLDGVSGAGGNTYLVESSADVLDVYAGGVNTLSVRSTGLRIAGGGTFAKAAANCGQVEYDAGNGYLNISATSNTGYGAIDFYGTNAGTSTWIARMNYDGSTTFQGDVRVPTKTPASASAAGTVGTIAWDASYLYACTAANTWKRAALSTW